jgi:hypothetical protein
MFIAMPEANHSDLRSQESPGYAEQLFWNRQVAARRHALWGSLTGRRGQLQKLVTAGCRIKSRRYAGVQLVSLQAIRGSENPRGGFDAAFRPLHPRMRQRWVRVAEAWNRGLISDPIRLIRVGDHYFVRDGHHRISVAMAMGQQYIDAEVIVWELSSESKRAGRDGDGAPAARRPNSTEGSPVCAF